MAEYLVYFEFFGRKMKTKVEAESAYQARYKVQEKIDFIKIERIDGGNFNTDLDMFKDIFGFGKK